MFSIVNFLRNLQPHASTSDRNDAEVDVCSQTDADRLFLYGVCHLQSHQIQQAIQSWQMALQAYQILGDRVGIVNALEGLRIACTDGGEISQAMKFHQQAVAIYRELGETSNLTNKNA